jgi:hypothetical protein
MSCCKILLKSRTLFPLSLILLVARRATCRVYGGRIERIGAQGYQGAVEHLVRKAADTK